MQSSEPGSNQGGGTNSLSGILSTLVPVAIIAAVSVAVFLIVRKRYAKVYAPRSQDAILWQENRRTPTHSKGFWGSLFDLKGLPDHLVLERNSLDGYLFLRYFKLLIVICFLGCCITWPVLFPVYATGGGGQQQLDILSFSNAVDVNRYYAPTFVAWVFLGLVTLLITRERMFYIGLRQAYFLSTLRAKRLTSRTVLFMGIPKDINSEESIRAALGRDVRNVWVATDCDDLEDLVKERNKAALKLEGAEVKLSKQAGKQRIEQEKKNPNNRNDQADPNHWIDAKKRPTHRLKFLIGKKVDTITWGQEELPKLNKKIASEQEKHRDGTVPAVSAAFVEYTSQAAAQRAYQLTQRNMKKTWRPRYIDVQPDEVIYKNLKNSYWGRKIKLAIATGIVTFIVLFWTPIILFIGALTNINYLTNKVHFLSFINDIPGVILGVVTGLLPTIILAVCIILVPIIDRLLAKFGGEPTLSAVELKTQSWYFVFQVIQVFLITTFSSGASAVVTQIIQNPGSAPGLLATNLPKASNFYISYFILYGLATAASMILNIVALLLYIVLGKFLDSTPRKMYNRWIGLAGIGWGSEYPKWTNLGVIALSYSCISPLLLGFATIGFTLLYLAFRYRWLFVLGNNIDMKGEAYSRALQQLMWGVYLSSFCLIGLFAIGVAKNTASIGPLVLMIVFLVVVIIFQVVSNYALGPLEQSLPLDLVSEDAYDYELQQKEQHTTNGVAQEKQLESHSNGNATDDSERAQPQERTGNKLTARIRPYIDRKFFEPNKATQFELPHIDYDYKTAYYNPAITAQEPFVWLARDNCGVSKMLVRDNQAAGIESSDDYAWFDEKNKLQWDTSQTGTVRKMLTEKKTLQEVQDHA